MQEALKQDISVPLAYNRNTVFILYLLIWEMYAPINQSVPIEIENL